MQFQDFSYFFRCVTYPFQASAPFLYILHFSRYRNGALAGIEVNLLAIKQLFFEFVIPGKIAQSSRDVRAVCSSSSMVRLTYNGSEFCFQNNCSHKLYTDNMLM